MKRVLLIANDLIGTRMAGPAMRYYQFAKYLSGSADVTLVVPVEPDVAIDFAEVIPFRRVLLRGGVRRLFRGADVVVTQQLSPQWMRIVGRADAKVIYDLYDPLLFEMLPQYAAEPSRQRALAVHRHVTLTQSLALATGDAFICASERQRDLWLGILGALGRIDFDAYRANPTLRDAIEVVPFGLEPQPLQRTQPALKGVVDGIREDDRVLLWGGGVWNWFDPLTVIRAVAQLSRSRDDVRLYFLGMKHPSPTIPHMEMASRAVALARELGAEGRSVFFNTGWMPYADRQNFLLEADLGVSAHFDDVETRYAFRTRLLDYFWAGLPTVTSPGDVLSDRVGREHLGRVVAFEDVDAWAAAIEELLDDPEELGRIQANLAPVRKELAWPSVVGRLDRLAAAPAVLAPAHSRTLWSGGAVVRRGLLDYLANGVQFARAFAAHRIVRTRADRGLPAGQTDADA